VDDPVLHSKVDAHHPHCDRSVQSVHIALVPQGSGTEQLETVQLHDEQIPDAGPEPVPERHC
jgi:hypothetical protein